MKQYIKLAKDILEKGSWKPAARENMPKTIGLFGYQSKYNLLDGFPLVTTKEVSFKNILLELKWVINGDTHIKYLVDNGCNIWNEDAYNYYIKVCTIKHKGVIDNLTPILLLDDSDNFREFTFEEFERCIKTTSWEILQRDFSIDGYVLGDCGKQYGWLWRNLNASYVKDIKSEGVDYDIHVEPPIDQFRELVLGLITQPFSRRHIIDAWNPITLDDMALPPCHAFVQYNVRILTDEEKAEIANRLKIQFKEVPNNILDCHMYQRSADTFLGVPYNIAYYSLLTMLLSNMLGMVPGNHIVSYGDVHIYENHISQMSLQISRQPKRLPKLKYSEGLTNLFKQLKTQKFQSDFLKADLIVMALETLEIDDIELIGYQPHPKIKGEVSTGLKK